MKWTFLVVCAASLTSLNTAYALCYNRDYRGTQQRFALHGEEAFDTRTGLVWKRCSLGTSLVDRKGCRGEKSFVGLDSALQASNQIAGGWRVPSGPELESLIDKSCGSPVVDTLVFPDIVPDYEGAADYWTSNSVGVAGLFYYFDFMNGKADGHSRGFQLAVRLVRRKA